MKFKKRYKALIVFIVLVLFFIGLFNWLIQVDQPDIDNQAVLNLPRIQLGPNNYKLGDSWLRQNTDGLWEMYIEGKPYERGVKIGHLGQELMEHQEDAFITSISEMVPAKKSINFIKYIIAWQNRNLQDYVPDEFQEEIFGISQFLSDRFDFVAEKFQRKLYYHAAHDIGHTVQNMGLIGCSAFAAWGSKTDNGELILGRNFDFYVGDPFAKQKLILFVKPEDGIPFMSYSWPGMIGVVSGMNYAGLTVTLNAGPPSLPQSARMPVSILARKILQYASTIDEAIAIAENEEIFVSEIFMIGSGQENKSILIEKSPDKMSVVSQETSVDYLIATNHFQSKELIGSEENKLFIDESSTGFRNQKLNALLSDTSIISPPNAIDYLRNWTDLDDVQLGIGNEMAINQMIAHHSIVFKPGLKEAWVSTGSSPMDAYIVYNLDSIFGVDPQFNHSLSINEKRVDKAKWSIDGGAEKYYAYKHYKAIVSEAILNKQTLPAEDLVKLIDSNPYLYKSYMLVGQYWESQNKCSIASTFFKKALELPIPWLRDREKIELLNKTCQ